MLHVQYIFINDFLVFTDRKKKSKQNNNNNNKAALWRNWRIIVYGANCRFLAEPLHD